MGGLNNSSAILSYYTELQLRNFPSMEVKDWPDVFKQWVNMNMSYLLLQNWLENHSENEYKEKVAELINSILIKM